MIKKNKICIVIGTRPEIIKMSPIIRECIRTSTPFFVIHTGQHYSFEMDAIFMKELKLPLPKYNLAVGSGTQGVQTAKMLQGIENILIKENPSIVLVQGDTNSVLSGAIAARKLQIPVGHIEAGLRSFDVTMPEELNRIMTDHISTILFAPTSNCVDLLKKENIFGKKRVFNVGNTVVDAVISNIKIANKKSKIIKELGLIGEKFILVTAHRAENVDNKQKLSNIIKAVSLISKKFKINIIWSMHPRTENNIKKFKLTKQIGSIIGLKIIKPVGYFDSLILQESATVLLTDSGGLQEESCILGTPCITLRENTERPESVKVGANFLAGTDPKKIFDAYSDMVEGKNKWKNPFGKGNTASLILSIIKNEI